MMIELFTDYPLWLQMIIGVAISSVVLFIVILLSIPIGRLLNKRKFVEIEHKFSEEDYLQGTLQSDLRQGMTSEVLLLGPFGARESKPCQLYSESDEVLLKGTPVVVVTVKSGVAFVIKQTTVF